MKTMRLAKMQGGGYLSALEQSRPELFQTIRDDVPILKFETHIT